MISGNHWTESFIEEGLVYEKESGVINESISDCLGEAIENYVKGSNDWIVFGEVNGARGLSDPATSSQGPQPATYINDTNWVSTIGCNPVDDTFNPDYNDNCRVHTNSGVGNFWFYLLSEGGSGINSNQTGYSYSVSSIGIEKAAEIVYYAVINYLTSTEQYADYREATIKFAEDLFSTCSKEVIHVGKAWYAVGLGFNLGIYDNVFCGPIESGAVRGINSLVAGGPGCFTLVHPTGSSVVFSSNNFIEGEAVRSVS